MICQRCMRAAARTRIQYVRVDSKALASNRALSTTLSRNAKAISATTATTASRQDSPDSSHQPAPATSTSAAQPLSTLLTPSPAATGIQSSKAAAPPSLVLSSVPAGTPLKGLNFLKSKTDPVAMEDSEYPSWLWDILKKKGEKTEDQMEGDLFSKSKKKRRLAAKRLRKQQLMNPELLAPKVPIYEQSIDLPAGNGSIEGAVQAANAREELRKAMRVKRRSTIKEGNFLKSMG
ncbi:hypothetical protein K432DRAFT_290155 [Lepidopterella palustris CBS 459.81]|uniref:Large ribosomal subunit protein mL54 n=1 Tax=Lepidopterella palustris CBS 459.81 TaxID=1314670 RepID=A0A8E2EHA7_9PEZI|nr:hypothetical protein K432DRAFT_290155 [Lepidopterella palustris CBS 459.81]